MTPGFWSGRRVLVTGHTGFKGSWLSLALQDMGARVHGYATRPPTDPSLFEVGRVGAEMASEEGDVRDLDHLRRALDEFRPEVVFHLAAQSLVLRSYREPVLTYETNVMGTLNLLEAVRHVGGVRCVIVVTSDKCYRGDETARGYRESDPMGGHDPYSSSKGCAELLTAAYRSSYFNPAEFERHRTAVATARAGNVVGGGDWAENRLVPDIATAFMSRRRPEIRNPDAVRPWQHVLESISGYLLLAEQLWRSGPEFAEAWNFGPPDEEARPVSWLAERLARLWAEDAAWDAVPSASAPQEAHSLKLDSSKAQAKLAWKCRLNLEDALAWTVEWYKSYAQGAEMRPLTLAQIDRYRKMPAS
jgi:CDP-glucose 4,6-dehydratase